MELSIFPCVYCSSRAGARAKGFNSGVDVYETSSRSIAYRVYCVTVLDKVRPVPCNDVRMPERRIDYDAMACGFTDARDPLTLAHPDLPDTLVLWERVTRDGMFFDPRVQGFTCVEVYNSNYGTRAIGAKSQDCFHPMYRMRARSMLSAINGDVVAFWTTKFADVVADAPGAVAAPSVRFGFPLWFFDRTQVDAIADVIFKEWQISVYQ